MRRISDLTKCNYTIIRILHKTYYGRFGFKKNSALKFRKFHVPNGTVHSDCTDPTQATARLVIVLVSRMQKRGVGDNNFVKLKGTFRSDQRNDQAGKGGPSKVVPNIPSTEPKYSRLSLNGHLYKTDTSLKRTPKVGPCLSLLLLFDSLQDGHLSKTDTYCRSQKVSVLEGVDCSPLQLI